MRVCVCGGDSRVMGNTIEARNWEPEAVRVCGLLGGQKGVEGPGQG